MHQIPVLGELTHVYSEVSEGWSGVSRLAVHIVSEYVTTPEPSRVPKSSDIVSRCPVDAFEDQVYKDIIATLKKVEENLNKEKIDLRKYNLDKGTEESVKKIFKFKNILMKEPSCYLRKER